MPRGRLACPIGRSTSERASDAGIPQAQLTIIARVEPSENSMISLGIFSPEVSTGMSSYLSKLMPVLFSQPLKSSASRRLSGRVNASSPSPLRLRPPPREPKRSGPECVSALQRLFHPTGARVRRRLAVTAVIAVVAAVVAVAVAAEAAWHRRRGRGHGHSRGRGHDRHGERNPSWSRRRCSSSRKWGGTATVSRTVFFLWVFQSARWSTHNIRSGFNPGRRTCRGFRVPYSIHTFNRP